MTEQERKNFDLAVNKISQANKIRHKKELAYVWADEDYNKFMKEVRNDRTNGWSKDHTLRHIATIPYPVYNVAIKLWGSEVFTDKKLFKKAFAQSTMGQWTLRVPKKSI